MAYKNVKLPDGRTVSIDEFTSDDVIRNIAWASRDQYKDIFGGVTQQATDIYNQIISLLQGERSTIQQTLTTATPPPTAPPLTEKDVFKAIEDSGEGSLTQDAYPKFEGIIEKFRSELPPIETDPQFANVINAIRASGDKKLVESLPKIEEILSQQSKFLQPQIADIKTRGEELAAIAQSEAMKRGQTGSDIEAGAMAAPRIAASQEEGRVRSQFAMQASQQMANAYMQAAQFDIQTNKDVQLKLADAFNREIEVRQSRTDVRQAMNANLSTTLAETYMKAAGFDIGTKKDMYLALAKAIGEKIQSDKSFQLAYDQLRVNLEMAKITANKQAEATSQKGMFDLFGTIIKGAISLIPVGGPVVAAVIK